MNIKHVGVGVVASLLSIAGCSGGDGGNLYDEYSGAEAAAIATVCECYEANGFTSAAECEEEINENPPTVEEEDCLRAVFDANEAELAAAVACEMDAFDAAQRCVNDVNECDETELEACIDAVETSVEDCPDVPTNVEELVQACFQDDPIG